MKKIIPVGIFLLVLVFLSFTQDRSTDSNQSDTVSIQLAKVIREKGYLSLAVLDFLNSDGRVSELGKQFMDESITHLSNMNPAVKVVERQYINQIMNELDLHASGYINEKTAVGLGEMVGADAIVVGTLTKRTNTSIIINIRIVDIKTGIILSSITTEIKGSKYSRLYNKILK
ncbi:MAG: CsgG/HfaB family protein [Treponema sp.]|jgi:curli biogenesis system outer membrane secretion channel CsgG|nr:CsgG/HfaB family protein [Treponema sp.]